MGSGVRGRRLLEGGQGRRMLPALILPCCAKSVGGLRTYSPRLHQAVAHFPCFKIELTDAHPHPAALPAGVVGGLVDMVRVAQKEKLVRVALLALQNLLLVGPATIEYAVVDKELPKAIANRLLQVGLAAWGLGSACCVHALFCSAVLLPAHCPALGPRMSSALLPSRATSHILDAPVF